MAISVI
ncbi:UNVERIFIED_CONTAM: hypothetical protein GTU68_000072 [Idotea baltica]|nr:hypothetical protein [Idotea baltica]